MCIVDFFCLPLVVGAIAKDRDGTVAGPTCKYLTQIQFKKKQPWQEGCLNSTLTRPKSWGAHWTLFTLLSWFVYSWIWVEFVQKYKIDQQGTFPSSPNRLGNTEQHSILQSWAVNSTSNVTMSCCHIALLWFRLKLLGQLILQCAHCSFKWDLVTFVHWPWFSCHIKTLLS